MYLDADAPQTNVFLAGTMGVFIHSFHISKHGIVSIKYIDRNSAKLIQTNKLLGKTGNVDHAFMDLIA